MADGSSVSKTGGYVLTDTGRFDLLEADTCECRPALNGGLFECAECGTVYGLVRSSTSGAPARDKWAARG